MHQSTELSLPIKGSTLKVLSTIRRHSPTSLLIAAKMVIGTTSPTSVSAKARCRMLPSPIRAHAPGVRVPKYWYATIQPSRKTTIWAHCSDILHRNITARALPVSRKGATDWTLNQRSTYETLVSSSSSAPAKWGLLSYFGRVNYGYKGRYLFEANLRADDSSRFGANQRWGYFPSFSGGWRISEESFMQGASDYLSNLNSVFPGERQVTTQRATTTGRQTTPQAML